MFISLVFAPRFWADYISFRDLWVEESLNKLVVPALHIGGTPRDPREPQNFKNLHTTVDKRRKMIYTIAVNENSKLKAVLEKIRAKHTEQIPMRREAFARLLGVTRQALWLWYSGDRIPSPEALERMAATLSSEEMKSVREALVVE